MKLNFIQQWIDFANLNRDVFSDNFGANVYLMPKGTYFIASKDSGYNITFNNGQYVLYYELTLFKDKLHIYGPIDNLGSDITKIKKLHKQYNNPKECFREVLNYQSKLDEEVFKKKWNYKPFNGGYEDILTKEFKHLTNIMGPERDLTLVEAYLFQQMLKPNDIILCSIDFIWINNHQIPHIFHIITENKICGIMLEESKLVTTKLTCIETKFPFTFKNKTLIDPFYRCNDLTTLAKMDITINQHKKLCVDIKNIYTDCFGELFPELCSELRKNLCINLAMALEIDIPLDHNYTRKESFPTVKTKMFVEFYDKLYIELYSTLYYLLETETPTAWIPKIYPSGHSFETKTTANLFTRFYIAVYEDVFQDVFSHLRRNKKNNRLYLLYKRSIKPD